MGIMRRGRGKSAALGLAIAGALALGYSNIFVSAPTPENLRTLFEFILKVSARAPACAGRCSVEQRGRVACSSLAQTICINASCN